MITYSQLGKNGRLGNQMFQYATLFSVALTRGYKLGIPQENRLSEVFDLGHAEFVEKINPQYLYKEKDFSFDPNVFLAPDGTDLFGYFQSGNYFLACKEALLKEFKFKQEYVVESKKFLSSFQGKNLCTVHIRRGDYKGLSHYHTNLGREYYSASKKIVEDNVANPHFLIFSDEPEWCKENFSKSNNITVVDLKNDAAEMHIMSMCKVHIIANSSFSWWGAYLSNSPAVISPKNWFGPAGPKNWDSIYEREWVRI